MSSRVEFRLANGSSRVLDGAPGQSLMQIAVSSSVPGIIGECGGEMSCATCHVYLEQGDGFLTPSGDETELLELVEERQTNSRLGCQLKLRDGMADVVVGVPGPV